MPCNDKMRNDVRGFPAYMGWYGGVGISSLHGLVWEGDFQPTWAGYGGMRGLEWREKAFGVFLSGNT